MDFQDLNAFAHVAQQGSFSKAAVSLRTAQSALSRRVLRLEHVLDIKLLERHGRGVHLTAAGEILLREVNTLLSQIDNIGRAMTTYSQKPSGVLRLALPPTTGQIMGPLLVEEARLLYPQLELNIREGFSGSIHRWVNDDDVDLAMLYDPEHTKEFVIEPVLKEPLYLVIPATLPEHDRFLAGIESFRMRELSNLPLILPNRAHSVRVLLERYAREHRFRLNVVNQVDGIRTTRGLLLAGLGYTVFSYAAFYEDIDSGALRAIPLRPNQYWTLAITHKTGAEKNVAVEAVKSIIRKQAHRLFQNGHWRGELLLKQGNSATKTSWVPSIAPPPTDKRAG